MALRFPHKAEVRLERPPLVEVICQIRFPPILRMAQEEPGEFQEHVRSRFPELQLEQGFLVRLPGLATAGMPSAETQSRTYRFRTFDGQTTASLAVDFYALSTTHYTHWEDFTRDLELIHEAIQSVYRPAYSTRIGLRYVDRFTLANTGTTSVDQLLDLIRPELTAQLRAEAWTVPNSMLSQVVLGDGDAKLALRTALGEEQGEPFFLLDFDYYEEGKLALENLVVRCSRYHEVLYDAFRWCLRDESLAVFNPVVEEISDP